MRVYMQVNKGGVPVMTFCPPLNECAISMMILCTPLIECAVYLMTASTTMNNEEKSIMKQLTPLNKHMFCIDSLHATEQNTALQCHHCGIGCPNAD